MGTAIAELRAFIDCYEAGHSREGEVVALLGLTNQTFRATRARFQRIRAQVPDELRRNAMEVMIQDGGPPVATVARRKGRAVEITVDETLAEEPVNDSGDSFDALGTSGDGGRVDGENQDAA